MQIDFTETQNSTEREGTLFVEKMEFHLTAVGSITEEIRSFVISSVGSTTATLEIKCSGCALESYIFTGDKIEFSEEDIRIEDGLVGGVRYKKFLLPLQMLLHPHRVH
jgi:hypothetical protein